MLKHVAMPWIFPGVSVEARDDPDNLPWVCPYSVLPATLVRRWCFACALQIRLDGNGIGTFPRPLRTPILKIRHRIEPLPIEDEKADEMQVDRVGSHPLY